MTKPQSIIGAGVGRVEGAEKLAAKPSTLPTFLSGCPMGKNSTQPLRSCPHRQYRHFESVES